MSFVIFIFEGVFFVTHEKETRMVQCGIRNYTAFERGFRAPEKNHGGGAEPTRGWCNPALPTVAGIVMTKRSPSPSISE